MSKWIYDGYTKVHSPDRKKMIENWIYHCSSCGHTVRIGANPTAILMFKTCPNCGTDMQKEGEKNG